MKEKEEKEVSFFFFFCANVHRLARKNQTNKMSSSVPRGRIWRSAGGVKGGVARGDLTKEIGVPLVHGLDVVGKNGKVAMLLLLHGEGAIRPPDGGVNIRPRVARVKVAQRQPLASIWRSSR